VANIVTDTHHSSNTLIKCKFLIKTVINIRALSHEVCSNGDLGDGRSKTFMSSYRKMYACTLFNIIFI
jgi:hypothetical protein